MTRFHSGEDESGEATGDAQTELDLLDDLMADYEAEYGPVPHELVQEAMREWLDYDGG